MSQSGVEQELLRRVQAGDEQAFGELFSRHRRPLKQMLEFRMDRRLRGREDASDILQEVYIEAARRLRHFFEPPQQSFYVWLRQVTQQRLIDVHRRHLKADKRTVDQEVRIDQASAAATSASMAIQLVARLASPSGVAMHAELVTQIDKALRQMDKTDREVLALRHFEELRNSEVAEVLGIKPAAASNRYVRALSRLGEILEAWPGFADER